jgi:uncharacterized SAM-binding protein YcdF (DUF218 family)
MTRGFGKGVWRLIRWSPVLIAVAWFAGLMHYAADIPDHVVDSESRTDAIVVLTGGSERLAEGLSLLRRNMGRKLFISGVHRGVDIPDLLRLVGEKADGLDGAIALGYTADNTWGNAIETAAWMHAEGFQSMRLVTGNYHMQRSLWEFRQAMPDVTIIPHPVFPGAVRRDGWWARPGTAHLITSEYMKYLAARLRPRPAS